MRFARTAVTALAASSCLALTVTSTPAVAAAPGDLVITEIMQNPSAVSDGAGEWFEITNTTADAIDMQGFTIQDDDIDSHVIGSALVVPAGGAVVLGNNADTATNGGVTIDYSYGTNLFLANGADEVVLLDDSLAELDRVEYDGGPNFPDPNGASMSLDPSAYTGDNNIAANWCEATTPYGAGDLGTPGTTNPPCGGVPLPLTASFDDCTLTGWEIVSVDPDLAHTWSCNSYYSNIEANGYGDSAPADEWLITPALDLDAQDNDTLTFRNYTNYSDVDYPQLEVLYSTDYSGDPTTATWTGLSGITFSPENSGQWVDSGPVDLSSIASSNVRLAFRYTSSGTGGGSAANWRLDSIEVFEQVPPPPNVAIHDVQGDGAASPLAGEAVTIDGIVVGDFQDGTGVNGDLNGFFVQEPDADADTDSMTSEGIFVYDGSSPAVDVSIGDYVTVAGIVSEYNDLTEVSAQSVGVVSTGVLLPTAAAVSLPATDAEREAVEGMYVTLPQSLVISEYYNFDRYGEIVLTKDRQITPTAIYEPSSDPSSDGQMLTTQQELERITLDDGRTSQNPDPAIHPNGAEFTLDNLFRGGDVVTNVTGVMDYSFGLYRIQPTQGADYEATNPRPDVPDVGGDLTISSFNVLNYFHTLDDAGPICGPDQDQGCRGADDADERTRQLDKIVAAMTAIEADVFGIIEVENTTGVEAMDDIVGGLNDEFGAGEYAYVDTGTIGTDAIKVGLIYRTATVTPVGPHAVLDSSVDPDFIDTKNRPTLAQTFEETATGRKVTVAVNHLKSKGSDCDDLGDPDTGDGQGNCNVTRTAAATALAAWLAADPTGMDARSLIVGDLNSYDMEDPIDALKSAGFTDLLDEFNHEPVYSYVFDGKVGYLDHALADDGLDLLVTGAEPWHVNADEPDLIDYDTSFKQEAQDALYAPDPYRSSDHDPVVVGLVLDPLEWVAAASDEVDSLLAAGAINRGQANALHRRLDRAAAKIEADQDGPAVAILGGILDQLDDFVDDGVLTAEQAAPLMDLVGAAVVATLS